MYHKQNLHTHTTYCDGKQSVMEFLEIAKEKGFTSIGFSGHSYMSYAPEHSMSKEGTTLYIEEIRKLQKTYTDMDIFCGIEFDMLSECDLSLFDYTIGSVHYLKMGDEFVGFDRDATRVKEIIDTYFNGNGLAYAKRYYETLATLPDYGSFDILGHFDLITKHSETHNFFDTESKEHLTLAFDCLKELQGKIPYFEVNTGAISRGYRTTPYPSVPMIKEMKRLGFEAMISSDCHDANHVDCAFDDAKELLLACGFRYQHILTNDGFIATNL